MKNKFNVFKKIVTYILIFTFLTQNITIFGDTLNNNIQTTNEIEAFDDNNLIDEDNDNNLVDEDITNLTRNLRIARKTISNAKELHDINYDIENDEVYNYVLTTDIDLSGFSWKSIGTSRKPFEGEFDGNGFTIKNLSMNSPKEVAGIFGYIKNATIQNFNIENFSFENMNVHTATAVVEANKSIIKNINVKDLKINNTSDKYSGGIATIANDCEISFCSVQGNGIISSHRSGGIVATANNTYIKECFTSIEIEGKPHIKSGYLGRTWNYSGSIIGFDNAIIEDCFSKSTMLGGYTGGIAGNSLATIINSYFSGKIVEENVFSYKNSVSTDNSYYNNEFIISSKNSKEDERRKTSEEMMQESTFKNWNFNSVWDIDEGSSLPYLRKLPKVIDNTIYINNINDLKNISKNINGKYILTSNIDVNNEEWISISVLAGADFQEIFDGNNYMIKNFHQNVTKGIKGLFGNISNCFIRNLNIENVEIKNTKSNSGIIATKGVNAMLENINIEAEYGAVSGGLISNSSGGKIKRCSVQGDSNIGSFRAGGIAGELHSSILEESFTNLDVKGKPYYHGSDMGTTSTYSGGLIGLAELTTIKDCFSTPNMLGGRISGLIGYSKSSEIINSYFSGKIDAKNIFSTGNNSISIKNSYFDDKFILNLSNTSDDKRKTSEEMMKKSTFENWDFENIWSIDEDNGYPYLQWMNINDIAIDLEIKGNTYEDGIEIVDIDDINVLLNIDSISFLNNKDIKINGFILDSNNNKIDISNTGKIYKNIKSKMYDNKDVLVINFPNTNKYYNLSCVVEKNANSKLLLPINQVFANTLVFKFSIMDKKTSKIYYFEDQIINTKFYSLLLNEAIDVNDLNEDDEERNLIDFNLTWFVNFLSYNEDTNIIDDVEDVSMFRNGNSVISKTVRNNIIDTNAGAIGPNAYPGLEMIHGSHLELKNGKDTAYINPGINKSGYPMYSMVAELGEKGPQYGDEIIYGYSIENIVYPPGSKSSEQIVTHSYLVWKYDISRAQEVSKPDKHGQQSLPSTQNSKIDIVSSGFVLGEYKVGKNGEPDEDNIYGKGNANKLFGKTTTKKFEDNMIMPYLENVSIGTSVIAYDQNKKTLQYHDGDIIVKQELKAQYYIDKKFEISAELIKDVAFFVTKQILQNTVIGEGLIGAVEFVEILSKEKGFFSKNWEDSGNPYVNYDPKGNVTSVINQFNGISSQIEDEKTKGPVPYLATNIEGMKLVKGELPKGNDKHNFVHLTTEYVIPENNHNYKFADGNTAVWDNLYANGEPENLQRVFAIDYNFEVKGVSNKKTGEGNSKKISVFRIKYYNVE